MVTTLNPLTWHPKRFMAGDLDNSGSDRLLGTPKLSTVATLVRETVQNSWDARLEDGQPAFRMILREGTPEMCSALDILLRDDVPQSPLARSLSDPHFHVLEILDRGTSGLDGPVDMSDGYPSNFQDLLLKVGVPRTDNTGGGGTFGFGKTAAYAYSRIGTIVYWSRCVNQDGELEHRFIVSAFRESYKYAGVQYTGRHWWGSSDSDGSVAPIVGDEAQRLGELLFEWNFPGDETGTSMLILDPPLLESVEESQEEDTPSLSEVDDYDAILKEWTDQVRHSIRLNLWPKLVDIPLINQPPMDISLVVHGEQVPLEDDPPGAMQYWAQALNAVRLAQSGQSLDSANRFVSVHEVTHQGTLDGVKRNRTLGHLAIVERIPDLETPVTSDDLDPITRQELGRVVRMRSGAELVVNSLDYIQALPVEGMDWLAVYKPTPEFDEIYAGAEPPAHDDWVSEGLRRDWRLIIEQTDRKIKQILSNELLSKMDDVPRVGARVSTAKVSKKLASLVPAVAGNKGVKHQGKHVATSRAVKDVLVRIISNELVQTDEMVRQVHRVTFQLESTSAEAEVSVSAMFVGADGAREKIGSEGLDISWSNARLMSPGVAVAPVEQDVSVYIRADQGKALRISVKARSLSGNN